MKATKRLYTSLRPGSIKRRCRRRARVHTKKVCVEVCPHLHPFFRVTCATLATFSASSCRDQAIGARGELVWKNPWEQHTRVVWAHCESFPPGSCHLQRGVRFVIVAQSGPTAQEWAPRERSGVGAVELVFVRSARAFRFGVRPFMCTKGALALGRRVFNTCAKREWRGWARGHVCAFARVRAHTFHTCRTPWLYPGLCPLAQLGQVPISGASLPPQMRPANVSCNVRSRRSNTSQRRRHLAASGGGPPRSGLSGCSGL
eukprot:353505-Chlamydomonas_euryale.AAC.4